MPASWTRRRESVNAPNPESRSVADAANSGISAPVLEPPTLAPATKQFPCKQCGAKVNFAPGVATLKCPYCSFVNPIPQSEEHIVELDFRAELSRLAGAHEKHDAMRVKCQTCGAETTMPPHVTAGICPFCGSNLVANAQSSSLIKPASLLPFQVTQAQALADFRAWIASLWFAPGDLKRYAESDHKLAGVYVPYWTYACDSTSFYRGDRGDDYWETETYTTTENGQTVTRTRQVLRTRWTSVSGTVWNKFADLLILASRSLPQKYADRLEPWDLQHLVPYADDYLSGFRAESYQVDLSEGFVEAQQLMDVAIRRAIERDIGGDHQRISAVKTQYDDVTFKHLLLPVWLSAYRYRDQVYRIMVNARTGEVQGERPYSAWKIAGLVMGIAAAIAVIAAIVIMSQS
jgi:DNA-directed RNA polymerase subunit RPC12/RpoP